MLENHAIDFLNGKIDMHAFQQLCRDIYTKCVSEKNFQYNLDAIKCLPFIHYFAFPEHGTSVDEFKGEVQYYLKLLHYEVEYSYSCVILLPHQENDCHIDMDDDLLTEKLSCLFKEENNEFDNIFGLLYNMLQKLICQYLNGQDDCFDHLNCSDNMSKEYLKKRILQLYMYYTGENEFILQLFCNTSKKDVFCIV